MAHMENILDIYEMPYNSNLPVVCMDEKPYQCLGEIRKSLPMYPGDNQKMNSEYIREGTYTIFIFTKSLHGWSHSSVRKTRTALDWAKEIKYLLTECYAKLSKIILVMGNLNTHVIEVLYKKSSTGSMQLFQTS